MKFPAVVLSSSILVACGGGGSDAPASLTPGSSTPGASTPGASTPGTSTPGASTPGSSTPGASTPAPSPAIEALAKYEGVWRKDCIDHMRVTKTATATSGTTFSVVTREDYYDNADCTGALVATGSYGVPDEKVTYAATPVNASVTLLTGVDITADVDPATSVAAVTAFTVTGSGVKATELIGTTMYARIEYADGGHIVTPLPAALIGQTTSGAFLLRNDELLALVPIDGFTNSFRVRHRYTR